jgi:sugar lactone lactonase YvrE
MFSGPIGLASDSNGNLYVADSQNSVIRKITPGGAVSTLAGTPGMAGYVDNVDPAKAQFSALGGIAVDKDGNVYVADEGNIAIRMIAAGTNAVSTLAGGNGGGFVNGTGMAAQFLGPTAIVTDASGNIFVTDSNNNAIRMITPGGVVTTLAGAGPASSGGRGWVDGTGSQAEFNRPTGLTLSADGNIYVSDTNNHVIRKVTMAGVVTTVVGTGSPGSTDGSGTAAQLNFPDAIASDASGILYVADQAIASNGDYVGHVRQITAHSDGSYSVNTIIGSGPFANTPGGALPGNTGNTVLGIAADSVSGNLFMTINSVNGIYAAPY